jgi:hypothetical protein
MFNPKWERDENEVTISRALEKVAGEVGQGVSSNAGKSAHPTSSSSSETGLHSLLTHLALHATSLSTN